MKKEKKSVAVMFVNWTESDFSHKWDSVEYTFKAGESQYIQDYLANHFAKHLAQREINKKNLLMSDLKFKEFYDKCFAGNAVEAETPEKLEMKMEEKKVKKEVKKEVKKTKKPENKFEGK